MAINCAGELTQTADGQPLCSGDWLQEPDVLFQLYELLNTAFSTPDAGSIGAAWMAGFSLPVIGYLVASSYGVVINWFK